MSNLPVISAKPANPHYQRLGGRDAIVQLVEAFYRAMDTRADARVIRAMHEPDLSRTKAVLVAYLSEWTGGPRLYSPERGAPALRRKHHPFEIDAAARDAWMACMREALAGTVAEAALRAELDAAFSKIADFIRNTDHGGAERPHPGRPRETTPGHTPPVHDSTAGAEPRTALSPTLSFTPPGVRS